MLPYGHEESDLPQSLLQIAKVFLYTRQMTLPRYTTITLPSVRYSILKHERMSVQRAQLYSQSAGRLQICKQIHEAMTY